MCYDDGFYNELSAFDMQMEEFKESLAKAIKGEFMEEMEQLRAENRDLRKVKENFDQIKRGYERKKQECELVMREAVQEAKAMRAREMMEKFKVFLWRPDWTYLYGPKCGECDKSRNIEITLPSGKKVNDNCRCAESMMKVMLPERMALYNIADRGLGIAAWYKACGQKEDRYYVLDYAASVYADKNIVEPGTSFDKVEKIENQREILFTTEGECRAYCGYLNEKSGVTSDIIYRLDGEVYKEVEELE